jgi:hypothetical protein
MAWSGAIAVIDRRQADLGQDIKNGPARYPPLAYRRCDGCGGLGWAGRRRAAEGSWLAKMLARKPRMLVAMALANKMARGLWAMLTKNHEYRGPVMVG